MSGAANPERAGARELALLSLCALENVASEDRLAALEDLWSHRHEDGALGELRPHLASASVRRFARRLLGALFANWATVDAAIEEASKRWRLARMDRVDRNVIRLAAAELRFARTPTGVVLAESARVADRFGSERSAAFVNGVVDTLVSHLRDPGAAG